MAAHAARMNHRFLVVLFPAVAFALTAAPMAQQPERQPWKAQNLQFFPADITREALTQRMREFSFALNVRCQYCHAGGDGISFDGVDFASDEKPAKRKARAMLRMTDQINTSLLTQVPSRAEPRVGVDCVTCHHGLRLPKTLQTTLFEIVSERGAEAAVARYRELRGSDTLSGRYSFDEWEINELARRLFEAKNTAAAIALLEMNGEFYPKSAAIDFQIAELHLLRGERDLALARFRKTLEKQPNHDRARARIAELEKR
jgi:tetratricopeptide (TPR) repeat protein